MKTGAALQLDPEPENPTPEDFIEEIRRIINSGTLKGTRETAARGLERGHLRIGADAPYHILPAVAAFTQRYPKLRLSLTIGNSEGLIRDLVDHRIDVAVVANLTADARLHALAVRRDRLVLFVPK